MTGIIAATTPASVLLHESGTHPGDSFALSLGRHPVRCGLVDIVEEAAVGSFDQWVVAIRLLAWLELHTPQLGGRVERGGPATVLVAGNPDTG